MLTDELWIHQFLLWVSSIDEWAELKWRCKNCCFMKNNIQQNLKSIDKQRHVINSCRICCFLSTNQWRFLSQSSFMIQTIECSINFLIYHLNILKLICSHTQFHEYWCCMNTICFYQIRWTKKLSHKKQMFWLWLKKTLSQKLFYKFL